MENYKIYCTEEQIENTIPKLKLTAQELLDDICDSLDADIDTVTVKLKRQDGTTHQTLTQSIKEITNYMRKYYKNKI